MHNKVKVLLVYPNLMLVSQLPNNIALLVAFLKQAGHDVALFDTTMYKTAQKTNDEMRIERMQVRKFNVKDVNIEIKTQDVYKDFQQKFVEYNPDVIAVSVVDDTVIMGLKLIRSINHSDKVVVFGGVYAIFNPESLIKKKEVDIVCTGEGEKALVELCDKLSNGQSYEGIKNFWVKKKNGQIVKNSMRSPIKVDDLVIEDFSLFDKKRIFRPMQGKMVAAIPINFDRGCPYRCSFCVAPSLLDMYKSSGFMYYRTKSLDRIYKEIKFFIQKYPVSFFYFNSETFLSMPLNKLRKFADMYAEFRLPFWCQTRIETISDEKIKLLKEMGCSRLSIGLEHGNEEFRKNILKKEFTNEQVMRAFEIIKKHEILVSVNNMIGFPDETRELAFDTINLNRMLKADAVNGFVFQPYTGTYLRDYCIEKRYLKDSIEMMYSGEGTPIGRSFLDMPQFSREEIEGILRTFALYVNMPKKYFPKIEQAEKLTTDGDVMLNELREKFFIKYFN